MTLSTFDAPHHRFCANGRSMLTQTTSTSDSPAASSLNRLVSWSHTGVSSEGTDATIRVLPAEPLNVYSVRSIFWTVKSGAACPTLTSFPTSVTGFPLNVTEAMSASFRDDSERLRLPQTAQGVCSDLSQ